MLVLPAGRLLPLIVRVAVAFGPAAASGALPSEVAPNENETLPVGGELPEAGFTVAVSWVVAVCGKLTGEAVTPIAVAIGGPVTVTVTVPDDAADAALPE